ncbi:TetR family transcriptional regulator [Sphingorhabdus arenilitoris]|uniref:TetR family transcriptional regulator n=1 Tax=Sphingorhabdus arenilitoris TaxID=1490041 RepID=A0ABV8RD52_9SPHN
MARPQTDIEAGRKLLLATVEKLIGERGAMDISMTELAAAAGMSPSNIYRFFDSKEALLEAVAEAWFADKVAVMEEVTASDMPAQEKMLAFFARRFVLMRERYNEDPGLFESYCLLGNQHFDVVKGYVDLGDHYLAMVVADAMEEGYFKGYSIDQCVSLINQMVNPYCSPDVMRLVLHNLSEDKLAIIIATIFRGLTAAQSDTASAMRVVS